jgi:hypothetical protein
VYIHCDERSVFRRLFNRSGGRFRPSYRTVGAMEILPASGNMALRNFTTLHQFLEMLCPFRSTFDQAPLSTSMVNRNRIERPSAYKEEKLLTGLNIILENSLSRLVQATCVSSLKFILFPENSLKLESNFFRRGQSVQYDS